MAAFMLLRFVSCISKSLILLVSIARRPFVSVFFCGLYFFFNSSRDSFTLEKSHPSDEPSTKWDIFALRVSLEDISKSVGEIKIVRLKESKSKPKTTFPGISPSSFVSIPFL